jgi:hypothetical protein
MQTFNGLGQVLDRISALTRLAEGMGQAETALRREEDVP